MDNKRESEVYMIDKVAPQWLCPLVLCSAITALALSGANNIETVESHTTRRKRDSAAWSKVSVKAGSSTQCLRRYELFLVATDLRLHHRHLTQ